MLMFQAPTADLGKVQLCRQFPGACIFNVQRCSPTAQMYVVVWNGCLARRELPSCCLRHDGMCLACFRGVTDGRADCYRASSTTAPSILLLIHQVKGACTRPGGKDSTHAVGLLTSTGGARSACCWLHDAAPKIISGGAQCAQSLVALALL